MLEKLIGKNVIIHYSYAAALNEWNNTNQSTESRIRGKVIDAKDDSIMIQYTAQIKTSRFSEPEYKERCKIINWRYIHSIDIL